MIKAVYDVSAHFTHGEKPDAIRVNGVDFEPVRHGRWQSIIGSMMTCPYCGISIDVNITDSYFDNYTELPNYCPNCGAKMDGKEENNEL